MLPLLPSLATALALVLYLVFAFNVGQARRKYGVEAPATTGNPAFERIFRVQQNTLEQLVVFIPALWLFSRFVSERWGGIIGILWILARIVYAWGYYRDAKQRAAGAILTALCSVVLLLGSIVGMALRY